MPMPKRASNARCCSGGSGADAERAKRTPRHASACAGVSGGPFSRYATIVGTRLSHVGRYASTSGHHCDTLKRCGMTMLPPDTSGATVAMHWPLMW